MVVDLFLSFSSRRQHRLEQEQADIEYEIRLLMAQPERNKPDSDKAREESLITRLVEVMNFYTFYHTVSFIILSTNIID